MAENRLVYCNRLLQTGLALIPACLGLFAFINNVSDWHGTVERMVLPLLSMADNVAADTQGWRALDIRFLAHLAYGFVTLLELCMGLMAAYAVIGMARHCRSTFAKFRQYSHIACLACMFGAFIYCFIFFTIGGDWFLSWKNENLQFLQGDSLNYATVLVIVFLCLRFSDEEVG